MKPKINQTFQTIKESKESLDEKAEKISAILDKIIRPVFTNYVIMWGLFIWLAIQIINSIVNLAFTYSTDKEIANMYVTAAGNVMLALITLYYVVLTARLVKLTTKEQKTKDLERRLEKFYIPAIDILKNRTRIADDDPITIERAYKEIFIGSRENLGKEDNIIIIHRKGFYKINKYRYLAYNDTSIKFEKFIQNKSNFMKKTEDLEKAVSELINDIEKDIKKIEHDLEQIKK